MELTVEQEKYFKTKAKEKTSKETMGGDWNPYEFSGDNFDDAYDVGFNDAEIKNARYILKIFEVEF